MSSPSPLTHASRAAGLGFPLIAPTIGLGEPFRPKGVLITPAGAQDNGLLVHRAQAQLQSVCKEEPVLWEHTWQEGTPSEAIDFCGWLSACILYPAPVTLRKYLLGWRPKDGWPFWTAEDWEAAYLP